MSYLTFEAAEWGCMAQLFFDNAGALLGILAAVFNMTAFGVPIETINAVSTLNARAVTRQGLTTIII